MMEQDAETAGSPLPCQPPPSEPRRVFPAAEWVWREERSFPKNNQELFAAQFVLGKNLTEPRSADGPVKNSTVVGEESYAAPTKEAPAQSVLHRQLIGRDSAFQSRLRGWLLSD